MKTFEPWEHDLISDYQAGWGVGHLIDKYHYRMGQHKRGYLLVLVDDIISEWKKHQTHELVIGQLTPFGRKSSLLPLNW